MNYTFNSMKKIPLIALLIFGCAGNLASKEETLLNENFSIPNKNQNELFNMCIQWISTPENNLNITKNKIAQTTIFNRCSILITFFLYPSFLNNIVNSLFIRNSHTLADLLPDLQ